MYIQPYNPDPTHDVFLKSYDEGIPLACNVIYYVESHDNETLNAAMRQLAQKKAPLFEGADIQPFAYRFQYLAQSELDEKTLRAGLSSAHDEESVDEIVSGFLHCLSDVQGGTLIARCLPTFSYDGYFKDDNTVCTFPGFSLTSSQMAEDKAKWFARETAMRNFYRLTGESYEEYANPRQTRQTSGGGYLGFMTRKKTKQEISDEMRENYEALSKWMDEHFQNNDEMAITILDMAKKQRQRKGKLTELRPMKIWENHIQLKMPGKELREIRFQRGNIAKMLYIFFLIQIKRSAKDTRVTKNISKLNLDQYKNDLLKIYTELSGSNSVDMHSIETVWSDDHNTFETAVASIRTPFKEIFDAEALEDKGKCYSIEIMDKDHIYGNLYGIGLDADDFELGFPYNRMV